MIVVVGVGVNWAPNPATQYRSQVNSTLCCATRMCPLRTCLWATRQAVCSSASTRSSIRQSRTEPQVRRTGDLGDMPLMVISADKQPADWFDLQKGLATLSTDSVHRVIGGST